MKLETSAATDDDQEAKSAAALGSGGSCGAAAAVSAGDAVSTARVPADLALDGRARAACR